MMKSVHSALAHPDTSGFRNRSPNMTMNIQIQIQNRESHSSDQNTWPVPNSAAIIRCARDRFDEG